LLLMSYWRPRRAWFAHHAPRLLAFADAAGAHPALAPVLARHLPALQNDKD
jgi:GST-like protein